MLRRFTGNLSQKQQIPLTDNLVAYYNLDGNANDSISTNNGSEIGTINYTTGINGQAPLFDSVTKLIEVPDNDVFSFTDGTNDIPFSISLWFNFSSLSNVANYLIMKRILSSADEYIILINSENSSIELFKFGDNIQVTKANEVLNPNQWYHLVITDDGSQNALGLKFYINSIEKTKDYRQNQIYSGMTNTNAPVTFGGLATDQGSYRHRGLIDLVGFWKNRVLSQGDVDSLYNNGQGVIF